MLRLLKCGFEDGITDTRQVTMEEFDEETDVLIAGSGGAGLTAALRAHNLGLRCILVEKTNKIGGTTALSGGGMWIPNNAFHKANGYRDSEALALTYMRQCIGEDVGPASSQDRREAFVHNASQMVDFLCAIGFRGRASGDYPNYYTSLSGGDIPRSVESAIFDAKKLGLQQKQVRSIPIIHPPMHTDEAPQVCQAMSSVWNLLCVCWLLGTRYIWQFLCAGKFVTLGYALICQLLYLSMQRNLDIRLNQPLIRLIESKGRVKGAIIGDLRKQTTRVRARYGVLLVAGGFAHNAQLRKQHHDSSDFTAWTLTQDGDQGDAVRLGTDMNARLCSMDSIWWTPVLVDPSRACRFFFQTERCLPHCIIVDSSGVRFMNEAQPYSTVGPAIIARNRSVPAIPCWFILDSNHRSKYVLAEMAPGRTPQSVIDSGFIYRAHSLENLARQISIDSSTLSDTVARFNAQASVGKDEDFGRGESEYDQFFADKHFKPNGCLGPIEKGPFYAVKVWPGDIGTKGGLLTDHYARVINTNDEHISGLYAAGNASASVMGESYPGPGSTLGPSLTFAYIAINHMASQEL